ncbi:hypothetical protein [Paraburkholderia flagellata]|uniref:hypothetical protein n=1 Tax=Paraburkholderia flagellata TaxID=2883241 RepID=UPI001F2EB021|nr:hypothetical protein [Paraburkholderia flagellata]
MAHNNALRIMEYHEIAHGRAGMLIGRRIGMFLPAKTARIEQTKEKGRRRMPAALSDWRGA